MRISDPQTDVAPSNTRGRNVRSKNQCSMCPAIHTKSRSWLRSSSTREPSDPLLRVVFFSFSSGGTRFLPNAPYFSIWFIREPLPPESGRRVRGFFENVPDPFALSRAKRDPEARIENVGILRRWRHSGRPPLFEPSTSPKREHPLRPVQGGEQTPHRLPKIMRSNRSDGSPGEGRPGSWWFTSPGGEDTTGNDPTTGSPTVTLLRLLLPLNDQVRSSFRHAAATRRPLRAPVRRPH